MQSEFRVEIHADRGASVIGVSGELDLASSPALEEALEGAFAADTRLVIIDLRALEFMDSTGLSILVKAHQTAEDGGRQLYLINGPPQVQRLLSLTGVSERLALIDAPEDVLGGG